MKYLLTKLLTCQQLLLSFPNCQLLLDVAIQMIAENVHVWLVGPRR